MIPDFTVLTTLRMQSLILLGCLPSAHRVLAGGAVLRGWSMDLTDRHVSGTSKPSRMEGAWAEYWGVVVEGLGLRRTNRRKRGGRKQSDMSGSLLLAAITGSILSIAVWCSKEYIMEY
jgi:hypothetical protein